MVNWNDPAQRAELEQWAQAAAKALGLTAGLASEDIKQVLDVSARGSQAVIRPAGAVAAYAAGALLGQGKAAGVADATDQVRAALDDFPGEPGHSKPLA